MKNAIDTNALNQLFTEARTANAFTNEPVSLDVLKRVYELAKMPPTSMNCQPARYVFLTTRAARERLIPALMESNKAKTLSAPACVIIATDTQFFDRMPEIWHQATARDLFASNGALANATAQRNGTLSGAYFIMAARALGLDCGPMSGFDAAAVNKEFFPDGRFAVNFLCNIGYVDSSKTMPRNPRFTFEQVAQVL